MGGACISTRPDHPNHRALPVAFLFSWCFTSYRYSFWGGIFGQCSLFCWIWECPHHQGEGIYERPPMPMVRIFVCHHHATAKRCNALCSLVAGDGLEPSTSELWAWRATTALSRVGAPGLAGAGRSRAAWGLVRSPQQYARGRTAFLER